MCCQQPQSLRQYRMGSGLRSFCKMLILTIVFVFFLSPALCIPTDRFIWYLFPNATNRLYGYQPQANQSFESEVLPSSSRVTTEDNVNGVWVPAGEKVNLRQFSASCFTDVAVCQNFTVSILFKINGTIPENETVDVIHQMPLTDAEYLVQFSVFYNGSHYIGVASVARGQNRTDVTGVIQQIDNWIHVAIVYTKTNDLELFLNGTKEQSNASSVAYNGSSQADMTFGSSNTSNGFFVSYLQIIQVAINQAEVTALKDQSFTQATNPNQTTVTVGQSSRAFSESDGTVTIFIEREGNLALVSVVMYSLSNGTAATSSDFTFQDSQNGKLIFKPGEITKSLSVNIINNTKPEMNESFSLTLASDDGVTNVSGVVQIFILDDDIDECASGPCQNNGTCTDLVLDYNCSCTPGFTGKNCSLDAYLWYLFPTGANRVYGYEPMTNQSFESNELSPGTNVSMKGNTYSLHIPKANEVILGEFANSCLENASVCDNFTISLLVYIDGSMQQDEDVHVLDSKSSNRGSYHIQFMVTKRVPRLEGHAFVVGGNSSAILDRKVEFPATNTWVHVAIVYSITGSLDLYMNSVMVTASDPLISTPWQNDRSAVQVSLGSTENKRDIFVSYLQIIKGSLSKEEISQLEQETRQQASSPSSVQLELSHENIAEREDIGLLTVPLLRTGNLVIASVVTYFIKNETFISSSQEVVIRPGESSGKIAVVIMDDHVPEDNETFSVTVSTSDSVTSFSQTTVNVTILDDDINECSFNPCVNAATCQDLHLDYTCTCLPGYTGKNCSQDINDCSPNPCQHGGNCTDKVNDYNCTCVVGYRGKDCEINIADCAGSPCQNNGRCTDLVNDYNCTCIPGYTGKNCTQDSFLWYLFPAGASRVYGYDTENNKSFESNVLPDGANVTLKEGFHGLCIPMKKEVIVGHFADQCLGNSSTCDSFTISFLAYVDGAVAKNEDVHILYSTPLTQGLYHVQFTVTRTVSRLEGQANIVGGNSSTLLERKGQFPGVNKWVHVAIVYSQSLKKLDLYMNSAKVTDPLGDIPWNNNRSAVSVSLASTGNQKDICVSYFQIIKGVLTEKEIQQLEQESRTQGSNPSMVEAKLLQTNLITNEDVGRLAVPVERRGNVFIASVLTFNSSNQDAIFHVDFNHPLHHELLIKPGEETAEISVNITEDDLHESNETFLLTLMSLDKVTTITGGSTTITILNNDIDECAPKPCLNGATCVDLVHDYNCTCVLGYTGRNCSTNIDDCTNGTCKNNGTCHDLVNDFICTCAPGFTGKTCNNDIDECSAAPCKNGAQCTNLINDYSCNCTGGFEGKNCSTDIDECSAAPCKNGAQCTNLIDDYRCKCTEGFEGKDCSTASASTEEESDELLRILFWACVGALAVCLLALITVGPYLCHKLKRTARLKQSGGHRNGWQYTGDL
ncbi:uncharacterized protein LOC144657116 [Oculina patagonica]